MPSTSVIYGQMLYQPTSTITMTLSLSMTPVDAAVQLYGGGPGYPYPRQVWIEDLGSLS